VNIATIIILLVGFAIYRSRPARKSPE
jgi:hypothetical protein